MASLRIALAQLNATVGDLRGNRALVEAQLLRAIAWRADLTVFPELVLTGYPPEDLLLKPSFIDANLRSLRQVERMVRGTVAVVGFVDRDHTGALYNAAAVLAHGRLAAVYQKQCLPNYGVFDERRYFAPGRNPLALSVGGVRVGVTICEDLWMETPARALGRAGVELLVNLSASPYHAGKLALREELFAKRARAHRFAIAYCNLVGGQDELVFDGGSLVLDRAGRCLVQGKQFQEDFVLLDLPLPARRNAGGPRPVTVTPAGRPHPPLPGRTARLRPLEEPAEVYEALQLGVRDYVRKNGFSTVVLGLSGGVDSALTACIAADALGAGQVRGVVMPSRYSSKETQADARAVARALGLKVLELSIEPVFKTTLSTLQPVFGDRAMDVTEQNLQARIRGMLLMACSNKFGWLVLTTGNKSEMATGYTTLYGDMAGGFAVIKDVPKTLVYRLARFRNRRGPGSPILERILRRAPTAELAPNQRDQDTLPAYETLDRILKAYIEEDRSVREILGRNRADPGAVRRVLQMVDRSEYKRRQGPPGIKITPRAFGRDRRMPMTNRYQQG